MTIMATWLQLMFLSLPPCIAYAISNEAFGEGSLMPIGISIGVLAVWFPFGYWVLGKVLKDG